MNAWVSAHAATRQRPARGRRRAFTLLEVLVALGMTALLLSVVFSIGGWQVRRASLEEAARQVESAIVAARARAQREGAVMLVRAVVEIDGSTRLVCEELGGRDRGENEPTLGPVAAEPPVQTLLLDLPPGVKFEAVPSPESDADAPVNEPRSDESAVTFELAVCLPDGRVEPGEPLPRLTGEDGAMDLTIARWSGAVSATPAAIAEAAADEGSDSSDGREERTRARPDIGEGPSEPEGAR